MISISRSKAQKPTFYLRNGVLRARVVPRKFLDLGQKKFFRGTLSQRKRAKNVRDKNTQFTTIPRGKNEKNAKS
jgi:hypothetical protein